MTFGLSLLAGLGLALIMSGIPARRRPSLRERTEPYIIGAGDAVRRPNVQKIGVYQDYLERLLSRVSIAPNEELAARLEAAGRTPSVVGFRIEQLLWGVAGIAAVAGGLAAASFAGATVRVWTVPVLMAIGAITAVLARDWWLGREARSRCLQIEEELPVALDLAALAVMAGESTPAALARVAGVLTGPFARELRRMTSDIRAGMASGEALEGLRRRCDVHSVDRFVQAVLIAVERGAPLTDVLRAQVEDAREGRRRRLMELAGRREVLMLVPVVFLLMPTVVLFALYPALVSLEVVVP
ncbi:MAG: pilus assembly protein TadB [Actinobacteria bacterium]|nr:pilus assembly protein TadB [Actinomycetota bacterium]